MSQHWPYAAGFKRALRSRPFHLFLLAVLLCASGIVTRTTSPDSAAAATGTAIAAENALPGDPTWDDFASVAQQDAISGYGSKISVNHGDSIDFFVTTTAASFTINVFRMGWYGGAGARMVAPLGSFPGVHQAIPAPDPVTGAIVCHWMRTTTLAVPSAWVSGVYLAKLSAASGNKSYIFFVVRNDGGTEAINAQASVTTYQAYNAWGGVSLYDNTTNKTVYPYPHATKVSFDRPFDPLDSNGAGQFLAYEYPFVRWAEANGYDVTYTTDVDTHSASSFPLTNHRALVSLGHDEYWSKGMRDKVESAVNQGMNAAFFSANTAYWQIRMEPSDGGAPDRIEVGYKDTATSTAKPGPDPRWHVDDTVVTTRWRDDPVNRPENGLLGVMYQDQVQQNYAYVVQNASNWVYAGTGFTNGSSVPGIVGYEYDKTWVNGASPAGLTVLSSSPVVGCCEGSGSSHANSTMYTSSGGGQVFSAGTIQWSWGLDNYSANYANAGIQRTTANILTRFSQATATGPTASFSTSSLAFGNQSTGTTSATKPVTFTNSGSAALTISSVAITGTNAADFAQTNDCPVAVGTLPAGSSCTFNVMFTPAAAGSRSATLSVTDDAQGSPHSVSLAGTGAAPAPAVTLSLSSLSFGSQIMGTTSAAKSTTLTNNGTAPATISSVSVVGTNPGDFAQTNTCPMGGQLAAGSNCSISVTFSPTAGGSRGASLSVADNAAGSPHTVVLTGTGVLPSPSVQFGPTSLAFGSVTTGQTSPAQRATLTNGGAGPLTVSAIAVLGTNAADFTQTNTCPISPSTLAAGASCTLDVTFTPTAPGSRTGRVSITDDAAGSPHSVSLSGTGLAVSGALFSDGFESGSLPGAWTSAGTSGTGNLSFDTLSRSGSASLKAVQTRGTASSAYVSKNIPGTTSVDVRGYYYLSKTAGTGAAVNLLSIYSKTKLLAKVTYTVDPTQPSWSLTNNTTLDVYSCGAPPPLNGWHTIELGEVTSTTSSGSLTLWLDGVQVCGATAVQTAPTTSTSVVDRVAVGVVSGARAAGLTVNVDDVVVSTAYVGK